ncbi:MAG: KTSC domain-containing protein [Clostridium sp.]|uniref:KTSC domain-containing protein n=1 Tax=Clostridium sp. TaxID=1506 RepID=UPI003EE73CD5
MIIKHVESTNLKVVMFDPSKNVLFVIFNEGSMYKYKNVTEKEFDSLFDKKKKKTVGELFFSKIRTSKEYEIVY